MSMMKKMPSEKRGVHDKGWLQSFHTFSFDSHYDPEQMGYRSMRVLNEEIIQGGKGFHQRMHQDIEIVTLILEGSLEYQDNLGNVILLRPGDVHLLSGGNGIIHSEYNPSHRLAVHFYQLWFRPEQHNIAPSSLLKNVSAAAKWGQWSLLLSQNGREGSLQSHQDTDLYITLLDAGDEISYDALEDRYYWVQILSGRFRIGEIELQQGDGLEIELTSHIVVHCIEKGELLLLDQA